MLIISDDNLIFEKSNQERVELSTEDLSLYLNEELSLNCTFKRFFELIYLNRELFNLIFHRVLGGNDIEIFYDDMNSKQSEYVIDENEILILEWVTDLYQEDFSEYVDFYIKSNDPNEPHGSIAFMSLADIRNSQIRISNDISIYQSLNSLPLFKAKKIMTLYEAIKGLFYEISFHGSPENRDLSGISILENSAMIFERNNEANIMTIDELLDHLRTNIGSTSNDSNLLDSSKHDNS